MWLVFGMEFPYSLFDLLVVWNGFVREEHHTLKPPTPPPPPLLSQKNPTTTNKQTKYFPARTLKTLLLDLLDYHFALTNLKKNEWYTLRWVLFATGSRKGLRWTGVWTIFKLPLMKCTGPAHIMQGVRIATKRRNSFLIAITALCVYDFPDWNDHSYFLYRTTHRSLQQLLF